MKNFHTLALAALLAAGAAGTAMAQQTTTLYAQPGDPNFPQGGSGNTGQVGTGGVNTGYGQEYMDVQGSGNGASYESFGVIDFTGDPGLPTIADSNGNSEIVHAIDPALTLDLFDSPFDSTAPGTLDFYLSESNTPIYNLTYDTTSSNGIGNQLGGLIPLGTGAYTSTPNSPGGTDYTYALTLPSVAAQEYVLNQLNTGGNLQLVVAADSSTPNVVGSFDGATSGSAPELTVTTAVPEANTPALLALGLLGLAGMGIGRHRRAA